MMKSLCTAIPPAFILLGLIVGGSAQGIWGNFLIQLVAILIIVWAALTRDPLTLSRAGKALWLIVGLAFLVILCQLVPLPSSLWTRLAGRERIVEAFTLLGFDPGPMPLSLTPSRTFDSIVFLLPPVAVLAASLRLKAYREGWFVAALLAGTFAGILLGILQVTTTDQSWYLYRYSAFGAAAGFFANSNHMATLLLVSLPFMAALASSEWARAGNMRLRALIGSMALGGGAVVLVGLILNGSYAIILLGTPVALASILLLPTSQSRNRTRLWLAAALVAITISAALAIWSEIPRLAGNSVETRAIIWEKSKMALHDHWTSGSGIGSFREIYQRDEADSAIEDSYVNHAHNDYLELLIETGMSGAAVLILFLSWWVRRVIAVWRSDPNPFARAATIASGAILLHSIVDFPLRTAAIALVMAMCLAMMTRPRITVRSQTANDLWRTRHLTLD